MTNNTPFAAPSAPNNGAETTTLNPAAGYLVVINTYTVEPEHAERVLDLLIHATSEVLRFQTGFVSANLHLSEDRTQVVNYAQWKDHEALAAAGGNAQVQERIQRVGKIVKSFSPVPYELKVCLPAHD